LEEGAGRWAAGRTGRAPLSFRGGVDPGHRWANGIRFYVRRAHGEPDWGRFINRFGFANPSRQQMWNGQPVQALMNGVLEGRYRFQSGQLPSVVGLVAGAVLGAILVVLEGHQTWRAAGSDTAELVLIALGVHPYEAKSLATQELPALPDRSGP